MVAAYPFAPPSLRAQRSNPDCLRGKTPDCFVATLLATTAEELLHQRDRELRTFLDARRPARGHGLGLGIEADRVRSVLVQVTEAGLLPAAEGVVGERHRDWHVDADHADLDAAREVARGVAIAGEDGDTV